jgi:hypothetical protein
VCPWRECWSHSPPPFSLSCHVVYSFVYNVLPAMISALPTAPKQWANYGLKPPNLSQNSCPLSWLPQVFCHSDAKLTNTMSLWWPYTEGIVLILNSVSAFLGPFSSTWVLELACLVTHTHTFTYFCNLIVIYCLWINLVEKCHSYNAKIFYSINVICVTIYLDFLNRKGQQWKYRKISIWGLSG